MLTREEILSGYKKVNFPDKFLDKSVLEKEVKNILFFEESKQPSSKNEKDKKNLSQSYVLPWRYVQKNFPEAANKNNTFSRGGNFVPKEPLIDIKIDNFKLIYDKYDLPVETALIYIKNNYGGAIGPYNLEQLHNLHKNKKLDSTHEFRTIDIFSFKDAELFSFQSVKIINEEKWIDLIIDSPLLKYNVLFKEKEKKEEKKIIEDKKEEKPIDIKNEEIKKEDKKEVNKPKETEGKWEVVGKKKSKAIKEKEDQNNEIVGLKTKESKDANKKGKKKKKQFEDTNFELGFQIK